LDLRKASISDDLNETVNYSSLCTEVEKYFQKEDDLIETAAERTAEFILLNYEKVIEVKVVIKNPGLL
jgi:dihydroneopterin aldolase/2-amino-4-hydroxy-6-hydroxymethyldihydropteridine diphosphokinase